MLGEVLRIARIANDMTITDVSTKTGVSISYITEIEKGKKNPKNDILVRLLQEYQIDLEEFKRIDKYHDNLLNTKEKLQIYRIILLTILQNSKEKQYYRQ